MFQVRTVGSREGIQNQSNSPIPNQKRVREMFSIHPIISMSYLNLGHPHV